ncbi:hypothetical protein C8R47DRAFT_1075148 [Mycena vitilis]|nr:hypothetical protein C8R47DRAFT_1075148 [Mycena vitilis]
MFYDAFLDLDPVLDVCCVGKTAPNSPVLKGAVERELRAHAGAKRPGNRGWPDATCPRSHPTSMQRVSCYGTPSSMLSGRGPAKWHEWVTRHLATNLPGSGRLCWPSSVPSGCAGGRASAGALKKGIACNIASWTPLIPQIFSGFGEQMRPAARNGSQSSNRPISQLGLLSQRAISCVGMMPYVLDTVDDDELASPGTAGKRVSRTDQNGMVSQVIYQALLSTTAVDISLWYSRESRAKRSLLPGKDPVTPKYVAERKVSSHNPGGTKVERGS